MSNTFQLSVVSPDKTIVDEVTEVVMAPGANGYFGVMAGHEPFVTELRPGALTYKDGAGAFQVVAVSGGFVEVSSDHVIVIADSAERASDIDIERAREAAERARRRVVEAPAELDTERARNALERANNRLRVTGHLK